jgi:hypothetical protein
MSPEERLCHGKLGRGAVFSHALGFLLDDGERVGRPIGAHGGAAEDDRGMAEPDEAVGHAVSKPAFLAHLSVKPRGKLPPPRIWFTI